MRVAQNIGKWMHFRKTFIQQWIVDDDDIENEYFTFYFTYSKA